MIFLMTHYQPEGHTSVSTEHAMYRAALNHIAALTLTVRARKVKRKLAQNRTRAKWLRAATRSQQVQVGAFWVSLTLIFEIVLGRVMGMGWPRIVSDYNPLDGGFMLAGLAFMFLTPMMVAGRLR